VSEDAVLLLLGNKCDLAEDDSSKAVKMKDGSRLADVRITPVNNYAIMCKT